MGRKPYEFLKAIGWAKGQCNIIIKATGCCCLESATYEVHDLSGKVIGKCCPTHGKETELLMQSANGMVTAMVGKN